MWLAVPENGGRAGQHQALASMQGGGRVGDAYIGFSMSDITSRNQARKFLSDFVDLWNGFPHPRPTFRKDITDGDWNWHWYLQGRSWFKD